MNKQPLSLDNEKFIQSVDKENLARILNNFPETCLKTLEKAKDSLKIPNSWNNFRFNKIIVSGMGGSGIVGDLTKTTAKPSVPFFINHKSKIGELLDKNTLSLIISFSGKTKETISCFNESIKKTPYTFVISTNGEAILKAKAKKIPFFQFKHPGPPRAALWTQFVILISLLKKLRLTKIKDLESSFKKLKKINEKLSPKTPTRSNLSKHLAYSIFKHIPVIITLSEEKPVGHRWATQFHENSKNFAFTLELPEAFHNFVECRLPDFLKYELFFIVLSTKKKNPHLSKAINFFEKYNFNYEFVASPEENYLEKVIHLTLIGDWASYYLSILNKIPPLPTERITWLKKH